MTNDIRSVLRDGWGSCARGFELARQLQLYGPTDAERAMRDGYSGAMPPAMLRASRDAFTIASELAAAADTLCDLSERFASSAFDDRSLSSADALLVGCGRLIVELRQRGQVTP